LVLERSAPEPAVSTMRPIPPQGDFQRRGTGVFFFLFIATLVLTPLLVLVGSNVGFAQLLAAVAALMALVLVPWRPIIGLYIITICAVVIEQEPLIGTPIGTDHLYIFSWPVQFQGLPERPIGFYILGVLVILVIARLLFRRRPLYGGKLFYPFVFFLAC